MAVSTTYTEKLNRTSESIINEVLKSKETWPYAFVNQHEAYAVILEEVEELWTEIKMSQCNYNIDYQRHEAIQAAAMIMRLIVELL